MNSGRHPSEKSVEKCKKVEIVTRKMCFWGGKIGCEWICGTDFWYSYSAVGGVFLVATFWQSLVKNDFMKISVVKFGRKNIKILENCRTTLYENAVFFRILRCGIALCAIYTS